MYDDDDDGLFDHYSYTEIVDMWGDIEQIMKSANIKDFETLSDIVRIGFNSNIKKFLSECTSIERVGDSLYDYAIKRIVEDYYIPQWIVEFIDYEALMNHIDETECIIETEEGAYRVE